MKKWIHSSTNIIDDYNVSQYLPKKSLQYIDEIRLEPDFDYSKNRSVNRYYVYFNDGHSISAIGIPGIKQKVKEYIERIEKR